MITPKVVNVVTSDDWARLALMLEMTGWTENENFRTKSARGYEKGLFRPRLLVIQCERGI